MSDRYEPTQKEINESIDNYVALQNDDNKEKKIFPNRPF